MIPRSQLVGLAFALALSACGGASNSAPTTPSSPAPPEDVVVLADDDAAERLGLSSAERLRTAPPSESPASRALPLIEEARALAVRFEHAEALAKIGEAQVLLESEAQAPADWAALHRALAYRGLFESNLGRDDRARAALAAAALLDPEAELSDVEFPPDIIELYDEITTELAAESPAALAVTTDPAGATVFIDGEAAGQTPLTLHAAPGQHYLSFDAFGRAHRNLTVEIDASGNTPLDLELPLAGETALLRQLLRTDDATLAAQDADTLALLRDRFAADVLVRVQDSGAALALRLADGAVSAGTIAPGEGSVDALVAGLPPPTPAQTTPPPGEDDGGSVLTSPWLWVAVAVVVAGGAATGIAVAATQEREPILRASSLE